MKCILRTIVLIGAGALAVEPSPAPLVHPPMRPADVGGVTPMGLMVGAHVTPSDHIYLFPKDRNASREAYDVFAMADGVIKHIQHRTSMQGSAEQKRSYDDYRIFIEHSLHSPPTTTSSPSSRPTSSKPRVQVWGNAAASAGGFR